MTRQERREAKRLVYRLAKIKNVHPGVMYTMICIAGLAEAETEDAVIPFCFTEEVEDFLNLTGKVTHSGEIIREMKPAMRLEDIADPVVKSRLEDLYNKEGEHFQLAATMLNSMYVTILSLQANKGH